MSHEVGAQARRAVGWSLLTEILARIVSPITQLILARLLAPEAFGVLAVVVLITSFADMLADAGFQKFLIQRKVASEDALHRFADVAFWTSLALSVGLYVVIVLLRDPLAHAAGNPAVGAVLAVAALSVPLTVVASTHQALMRRAFEYKRMLPIRLSSALATAVVSIPLAAFGLGHWALVWGVLASAVVAAALFTFLSHWRPTRRYSFTLLRQMLSFSAWSLLEAVSIWVTTWATVLVVSRLLTPREVGLFQQPVTIVNAIFALITAATTPVLFTALSRLQDERPRFREYFLQFQFAVALVVLPGGVIAFFFRDALTRVLLGDQWSDAALMFGTWALSTAFMIPFSHYCSEVYRALGKPRVSTLAQVLYMLVLIPTVYFAAKRGFEELVIAASAVRVAAIVINQILTYKFAGIGFVSVARNLAIPLLGAAVTSALAAFLVVLGASSVGSAVVSMAVCGLLYVGTCLLFSRTRRLATNALPGRLANN